MWRTLCYLKGGDIRPQAIVNENENENENEKTLGVRLQVVERLQLMGYTIWEQFPYPLYVLIHNICDLTCSASQNLPLFIAISSALQA